MNKIEVAPASQNSISISTRNDAAVSVQPIVETDDLCWFKLQCAAGAHFSIQATDALKMIYRVQGRGGLKMGGKDVAFVQGERVLVPEGMVVELLMPQDSASEDVVFIGANQLAGALFNTFQGTEK